MYIIHSFNCIQIVNSGICMRDYMTANLLSIPALSSVFLTVQYFLYCFSSSFGFQVLSLIKYVFVSVPVTMAPIVAFEFHNLFPLFYHAINIFPAFHSFSFFLNVKVQNLRICLHLLYFVLICNGQSFVPNNLLFFSDIYSLTIYICVHDQN